MFYAILVCVCLCVCAFLWAAIQPLWYWVYSLCGTGVYSLCSIWHINVQCMCKHKAGKQRVRGRMRLVTGKKVSVLVLP